MWHQLEQWDIDLLVYLNNLGVDEFDFFWIFITQIQNWVLVYILFFFLFFKVYSKSKAILGIVSTIIVFVVALGLTNIVKYSVARIRPNNVLELKNLIRVLQNPESYSFFSGHATVSFAITTFVVLALKTKYKWMYVFYIWPVIFSMSRIFVGVHYPSDILVGSSVGLSIGSFTWCFFVKKVILS